MKNNKGFSMIEIILSIALLGIISVGLITGLTAQFRLLKNTQKFTEDVASAQQDIELQISDVKKAVQDNTEPENKTSYTLHLTDQHGNVYNRTVEGYPRALDASSGHAIITLFAIVADQKMPEYPVAEVDTFTLEFSDDSTVYKDNPALTINSNVTLDDDEHVNLTNIYRWYVSRTGFNIPTIVSPAETEIGTKYPRFPNDYTIIHGASGTYLSSDTVASCLGRHVICTVTPASQSGKMGATAVSNPLFVGGLPLKDDLLLHLDASMINKESSAAVNIVSNKYYVKNWIDISGNGDSVVQTTANRQPELSEAYIGDMVDNGLWYDTYAKYVYFDDGDGTMDRMTVSTNTIHTDRTVFVVSRNHGAEKFEIYQDTYPSYVSITSGSSGGVTIGNTSNSVDVAEVIIYDGTLSQSDADAVNLYLNNKYRPVTPAVSIVSLQAQTAKVLTGASYTLPATVPAYMSNGRIKNVAVTWSPSTLDTSTAGVKYSTATAVDDTSKTTTLTLFVEDPIRVTGVTLNKDATTIQKDSSETLYATIAPDNATNQAVTWSSSNTSVATVDGNGNVTGVGIGSAWITVTTVDGGYQDSCNVTVSTVSVTGVSLNKSTTTLSKNDNETLIATVTPANATNKAVTWSSSNTGVVTVDSTGKVRSGNTVGTATITVRTNDGGYTATCRVYVTNKRVSSVTLNKHSLSLLVGETSTLTATVGPNSPTPDFRTVTWSSSDTSVATVSTSGVVTGVAPGSAVITVTTDEGGLTDTCQVTVAVKPVTSVSLNKSATTINSGSSETLIATVYPTNATNKAVTWSSSNTSVATVSDSGVVTGVAAGNATITVRTADGGFTATCQVTVTESVTGVSLNKSSTTINKGSSETLTATVAPSNATNKNVTWSSSNTSVATVNGSGTVTGVAGGSATITVRTADGGFTATCQVTVIVPVTSVSLNKSATTIRAGSSETLTATVYPADATNKTVTWSSNNTSVATVSSGIVTGVSAGSATITVRTADGGFTATCQVTVTVPVSSVSLNKSSTTINKGNSETLIATVYPVDATNKAVTWSSNNTSVATVSSGIVTGVSAGSATITVRTSDGGFTATCQVTVIVPVTGVSLNKSATVLNAGSSETLIATVAPTNATNKAVTWSSSNTSVATVNGSGTVMGAAVGTATITVTTSDGGYTATCSVRVVDTIPPTVTTLGNGWSDVTISGNSSKNLVFSEILSDASKNAVQTALTNGCDRSLTFSWSGATLTITRNGSGTGTFEDDVRVSITDLAGNTTTNALLIDSWDLW